MKQSELMPLYQGLRIELGKFAAAPSFRPVNEAMQERFDRALVEPVAEKKPAPKTQSAPQTPPPRRKKRKGLLGRVNEYRKKGVLKKAIKQRLYRITPLRKLVHGAKRLIKK